MRTHNQVELGKTIALRAATLLAAFVLIVSLAACSIHASKDERGEAKKVDIKTPFGGLHVNAENVDPKDTGIPVYPGAQPVKETEHDSKSANVNIESPFFSLKVVALKYHSDDSPAKVLDFYRDKLKSYGSVLECKGVEGSVNTTKPGESKELTCGNDERAHIDITGREAVELKVGTTDRQHVVAVKPSGSGSDFSLVYVQTRGRNDSM